MMLRTISLLNVGTKFYRITQPGGLNQYFPPRKKPAPDAKSKNAPKF